MVKANWIRDKISTSTNEDDSGNRTRLKVFFSQREWPTSLFCRFSRIDCQPNFRRKICHPLEQFRAEQLCRNLSGPIRFKANVESTQQSRLPLFLCRWRKFLNQSTKSFDLLLWSFSRGHFKSQQPFSASCCTIVQDMNFGTERRKQLRLLLSQLYLQVHIEKINSHIPLGDLESFAKNAPCLTRRRAVRGNPTY